MDKNHKAAEELGEQISKQTKSTLISGVELLLLDSKLKDNKPGVELKTKKEPAITPEQRQRMESNSRKAFLEKHQRKKIRAQAAVRPKTPSPKYLTTGMSTKRMVIL